MWRFEIYIEHNTGYIFKYKCHNNPPYYSDLRNPGYLIKTDGSEIPHSERAAPREQFNSRRWAIALLKKKYPNVKKIEPEVCPKGCTYFILDE